ncbi:MAG: sugar phosphate isomerase/epimerase family protein [Nitrososphaera sp.]
MDPRLKLVTSVAPYVTTANAFQAIQMAHEDGFSGIELSEDHVHCLVNVRPGSLKLMREYSADKHMINSIHKTLHRPSVDSTSGPERKRAVSYTLKTLDYMEKAGITRMVLHSFSDLPTFFTLKDERANAAGYFVGCNAVKIYGLLAPAIKLYREKKKEQVERSFLCSLTEIARYAADMRINGKPIEIVFEEHYSDSIDYDSVSYGSGVFANVIRGIDTAHHLIRTGQNSDLSGMSGPIHYHAVDTNGIIDDHRTLGRGKVDFRQSLSSLIEKGLTSTIVIEDSNRRSALASRDVLYSMIKRAAMLAS